MLKSEAQIVDQAAGLRGLAEAKPVQVIAVTAGKGGVGKTNVAVNLAIALSKSQKVLLLDADLGMANVDVLLGLEAQYNLAHVMNNECQLDDIVIEGPRGLKIIPAASGKAFMANLQPAQHAGLISAFGELTQDVDTVIVDTAAGISDSVLSFARAAHEVMVVVCDEPTSITDAYALIKVMSKYHNCERFKILVNMVSNLKEGRDLYARLCQVTDQFLDVCLDYMGAITYDEYVKKAVKRQRAVVEAYPSSHAAKALVQVAEKIANLPIHQEISQTQSFFIERFVQAQIRR